MATTVYGVSGLLTAAEEYCENGDYLNAFDYFDTAIGEMKKEGHVNLAQNDKPTPYARALAHKGVAHLTFAQTLDELDPKQYEQYNLALYCLNQAIGVTCPENNPEAPLIDILSPSSLTSSSEPSAAALKDLLRLLAKNKQHKDEKVHCQYAWALAHRGEVLRVTADHWLMPDRAARYHEAIECFWKALELNPSYSWALAHLGATIVNARALVRLDANDSKLTDEEKDKHYTVAMQYLDMALENEQHNYPWCLAYKGVIYVERQEWAQALCVMLSAMVQNPKLLDFKSIIRPPWEFGERCNPEMLYAMATTKYLLVANGEVKPYSLMDKDTVDAYRAFYLATRITYRFWSIDIVDSKHATMLEPTDLIAQAQAAAEKLDPNKPDHPYLLGSLLALWLKVKGANLPEIEKQRNTADALEYLRKAILAAHQVGGHLLANHFKASARVDKAWYDLQNNKQFCQLTQHYEMRQSKQ